MPSEMQRDRGMRAYERPCPVCRLKIEYNFVRDIEASRKASTFYARHVAARCDNCKFTLRGSTARGYLLSYLLSPLALGTQVHSIRNFALLLAPPVQLVMAEAKRGWRKSAEEMVQLLYWWMLHEVLIDSRVKQ